MDELDARPSRTGAVWLAVAVLPVAFVAAAFALRAGAGPFWMWYLHDNSYFYLLDSLHLVNLERPGHILQPGTPAQVFGALVLKAMHWADGADAITDAVLADPERHLAAISTTLVLLNGAALAVVGLVAAAVWGQPAAAVAVQTGPFLSMLVMKRSFHPNAEPLLVFAMLMVTVLTLVAVRPGVLEKHDRRFAIAFGVVAGFAVAAKITAAPLFVMPLVLLARWRAIRVYLLTCLLAFVVFTLPAVAAAPEFFDWISRLALGSGVYGGGAATVIDPARYPTDLYRMLSRPVLHVPLVVSAMVLAVAGWRHLRGRPVPGPEARALAGVCLGQLAQVLLVAKMPSGHYLIPSFVLSALSIALIARVIGGFGAGTPAVRRRAGQAFAVLVAALVVAQGVAVARLGVELRGQHRAAASVPADRFAGCARVSFYSASSPTYALYLANYVTGERYSDRLDALAPGNEFWFQDWFRHKTAEVRDWHGPRPLPELLEAYPCAVFRGTGPAHLVTYLTDTAPGRPVDATCRAGAETILTMGVDCDGRPLSSEGKT